jgi:hypothetical protein
MRRSATVCAMIVAHDVPGDGAALRRAGRQRNRSGMATEKVRFTGAKETMLLTLYSRALR